MKELLEICAALKKLGPQPCALATIIQVEGSAYRRPGARMLITPDGRSWGMISGGCLEHDILYRARGVLESGQAQTVRYDSTSNEDIVFGTGLGCNGIVEVFIEPVTIPFRAAFMEAIERCQATRQTGAVATVVAGGETSGLAKEHAFLGTEGWDGDSRLVRLLDDIVLENEKTLIVSDDMGGNKIQIFIQTLLPPRQLIVFGGWLDVLPLVRMAKEAGFQVSVVDASKRTTSLDYFREADSVLLGSPGDARSQIQFDARTVAVLMNHNFERDQAALETLTRVTIPFVGLLGPARRKQRLLEALRNDGTLVTDEFEQNLHGPVGLDLGADTPEEIALSIMAEILAVLNGRDAEPIRNRSKPLHASPALAYV